MYNPYDDQSFFSTDRLVEFGLSMAVANQMVGTMNQTMANMHIPGAGNPMRQPEKPKLVYYAVLEGKPAGPFSDTEVARLINEKKMDKNTYVWYPGLKTWVTAENLPEVLKLIALTPPQITGEIK